MMVFRFWKDLWIYEFYNWLEFNFVFVINYLIKLFFLSFMCILFKRGREMFLYGYLCGLDEMISVVLCVV